MNPHARLITATEAAHTCGVARATIRDWVRKRFLTAYTVDPRLGALFLEADVLRAEKHARSRRTRRATA